VSSANTSRRVAFETIRAVNESDAYANLLLPKAIARAGLDTADAGLATELTYGTLRRQGTYDAVIQIAADRPAHEIDPAVLDALRLGARRVPRRRQRIGRARPERRQPWSRRVRERGAAAHLAGHTGGVDGAGRGERAL
jgi:16S rRNA (cytosine967-C5)-methyltransferase